MQLRNWEFFGPYDTPMVGATVQAYEATLTHPSLASPVASTVTDSNGMWAFASLSETAKDIKVTWGGLSLYTRWYKGMTQHNVSLLQQASLGSSLVMSGTSAARPAPGVAGRLYYVNDGLAQHMSRDNGVSWDDHYLGAQYLQNMGYYISSGSLANRPGAGAVGRLYYVTDANNQRLTKDTGTSWEDFSLASPYLTNVGSLIGSGSSGARPAAGTIGRLYYVNDGNNQHLTRDTGSGWEDQFTSPPYRQGYTWVSAQPSVATAIPAATWTKIGFGTELGDTLVEYNAGLSAFFPGQSGLYLIDVRTWHDGSLAANNRYIWSLWNAPSGNLGSEAQRIKDWTSSGAHVIQDGGTIVIDLVANQGYAIAMWTSTAQNVSMTYPAGGSRLTIRRL